MRTATGDTLSDLEVLALRDAARGLVSGILDEWPVLLSALRACGFQAGPSTTAWEAKRKARAALGEDDR